MQANLSIAQSVKMYILNQEVRCLNLLMTLNLLLRCWISLLSLWWMEWHLFKSESLNYDDDDDQMSGCVWENESINSLWTVQWHKVKPKSEILYSSRSRSRTKMRRKGILPKWRSGGWLGQKDCVSHWHYQVVCHQTQSFTFFFLSFSFS